MRTTTNEKARREVLRALRSGPRTGSQLADDLAARCGSKEIVGRAIGELHDAKLLAKGARVDKSNVWTLTAAGAAAADEHDRKAAA